MGLFSKFFKKKRGYMFTDEDRNLSVAVREARQEAKLIKEQLAVQKAKMELEAQREELEDIKEDRQLRRMERMAMLQGEDEGEDNSLLQLLLPMFLQNQNANQSLGSPPTVNASSTHSSLPLLTAEEIDTLLQKIPKPVIKKAKKLSDEELENEIKTLAKLQGFNISEENITAIIKQFREKFK